MRFSCASFTSLPTFGFLFNVLIIFFLLVTTYGAQAAEDEKVANIGAIIDVTSRVGKEQKVAMEIAAQQFNNKSRNHKLSLHFQDSGREPLIAASSAEQMIQEKKIEVIVMKTWQEAAIVGKVENRTQVPIISLAAPSITPPLMQLRWPFLITMATDLSYEIECIADLVCAYNWRKVVVIFEDDEYGRDMGMLSLLNEALQRIGSEIEYRLVLPPHSSLSDPKGFVLDEVVKLLSVQSRAFIVLRSSLPMVSHLFSEAKKLGLLEKDSAWIVAEGVTSLLNSLDHSVISSMKGTLGIKTYYDKNARSYNAFYTRFMQIFGEENPQEGDSSPGIYALQAYDSIGAITQALERTVTNTSAKVLLENILAADFDGLSGTVSFKEGKLLRNPILRVVNVVGSGDKELVQEKGVYNELDFWMPEYGFLESLDTERKHRNDAICRNSRGLAGSVVWPGNLENRKPRGWAMPTTAKPLRIAVPSDSQFDKFVTIDESNRYSNEGYDGFCIQIFKKVLQVIKADMNYDIPYQFSAIEVVAYDELIEAVYNKTYDAIVGDVTILADRLNYVDFTQPYTESGLSMVVPIKSGESAWMFMKPFTWEMWVATAAVLVYTMFVIWFVEHPTNSEFSGSLKKQIGTTVWFTFSSLFFAHREKVHSNITRVVVVMWLFVVFILTASYTASLSSMLTVKQLEPEIDIEWLKREDQKMGCGDHFLRRYLENVLHFKPNNIIDVVPHELNYLEQFREGNIKAAFFEVPYEKVFLNKYCKDFTTTARTYRFGGLGFVFQKGSPLAKDFTEAILKLSEDGNITSLEKYWLTPSNECSLNSITTNDTESLSLKSFWGIFLISVATSTICFLLALARLQKKYQDHQRENGANQTTKNKTLRLARYFYNSTSNTSPERASPTTSFSFSANGMPSLGGWNSSRWEFVSTSDATEHLGTSPPAEIEITTLTDENSNATNV